MSDVRVRLVLDGDQVVAVKPAETKPAGKPKIAPTKEDQGFDGPA